MKESTAVIAKSEDLIGKQIGVQGDSSALEMLKADPSYDSFKDDIKEYKTYDAALMDLKTGRLDAVAIDQVLGEYTNNNMDGIMKVQDYDLGDDFYAIGFAQGDEFLVERINYALENLISNGKAAEISKKWFGKNIVINQPNTTE